MRPVGDREEAEQVAGRPAKRLRLLTPLVPRHSAAVLGQEGLSVVHAPLPISNVRPVRAAGSKVSEGGGVRRTNSELYELVATFGSFAFLSLSRIATSFAFSTPHGLISIASRVPSLGVVAAIHHIVAVIQHTVVPDPAKPQK
jgi:hypothetical protein